MFKNLDNLKMPYGVVYINGHVSYVYDSTRNSKFVCAEATSDIFCESLKKMIHCKVPKDTKPDEHIHNNYTFCNIKIHSDETKTMQCKCLSCIRQTPALEGLCLEALELNAYSSVYSNV
jgi:hypothetical protein